MIIEPRRTLVRGRPRELDDVEHGAKRRIWGPTIKLKQVRHLPSQLSADHDLRRFDPGPFGPAIDRLGAVAASLPAAEVRNSAPGGRPTLNTVRPHDGRDDNHLGRVRRAGIGVVCYADVPGRPMRAEEVANARDSAGEAR